MAVKIDPTRGKAVAMTEDKTDHDDGRDQDN